MKTKALIFTVIFSLGMVFQSCEKDEGAYKEETNFSITKNSSNFNKSNTTTTFDELGVAHNELLMYFATDLDTSILSHITTIVESEDYFIDFIGNELQNRNWLYGQPYLHDLSSQTIDSIKQYIYNNKVAENDLINLASNNNVGFHLINETYNNGLINTFEYSKLNDILQLSIEAYSGNINIVELKDEIQNIKNEWINNDPNEQMLYLGSALLIAESSIDWWKENPDMGDIDFGDVAIAPWAAGDIAGAS